MRASLAVVAGALIALGCSSNNSATGPDPRNCTKGSVTFPATITGKIGQGSCTRWDFQYSGDSVFYDSYDVHLDSGGAYLMNLQAQNDSEWDATLEVVGTDPATGDNVLLAISDDEGGTYNECPGTYYCYWSQLYFVAPKSGTYSVRVSGYDLEDTAKYVLKTRTCANVLPPIKDSIIASAQTITTNDCWIQQPLFTYDSVQVKLFTIFMEPGRVKQITVSSAAFEPGFQVFGPGFGVPCGYGFDGCGGDVEYSADDDIVSGSRNPGAGSLGGTVSGFIDSYGGYRYDGSEERQMNWPGQYTIATGPGISGNSGAFTLTVQDVTGDGSRVASHLIPDLYQIRLEHPIKKPIRNPAAPAFLRSTTARRGH
jgi:hypothetical protein